MIEHCSGQQSSVVHRPGQDQLRRLVPRHHRRRRQAAGRDAVADPAAAALLDRLPADVDLVSGPGPAHAHLLERHCVHRICGEPRLQSEPDSIPFLPSTCYGEALHKLVIEELTLCRNFP